MGAEKPKKMSSCSWKAKKIWQLREEIVKLTIEYIEFLSNWPVIKGYSLQKVMAKYFWLTRTAVRFICFSDRSSGICLCPPVVLQHYRLALESFPLILVSPGTRQYSVAQHSQNKVPAKAVTQITVTPSSIFSFIQLQVRTEAQWTPVLWHQQPEELSGQMGGLQTSAADHWHTNYTTLHPKHCCCSMGSNSFSMNKPKLFLQWSEKKVYLSNVCEVVQMGLQNHLRQWILSLMF